MPSGFFYGEIRMDMFGKFKSIFGYENNEDEKNKIDSYGVDHSNFSLRDEIEYQMARVNREDQFKQSYNKQGITDNYPQLGKSFWGNNSENNYGFGSSNISENIEQMKTNGMPKLEETLQYQNQMNNQDSMTTPTPWEQSNTVQQLTMPVDTQQLTMPAGTQQQITMPRNQFQQESGGVWNTIKRTAENFADATEAGTVGYTSGLTLGNFDEGMGAATALVTGNSDHYRLGRDATRQLQNDLQQRHPYIYEGAEFVGAMASPTDYLTKFVTPSKIADATVSTLAASAGYAKNWKDFGENLIANGVANTAGLIFDQLSRSKGVGRLIRKPVKQLLNYSTDKAKNWYYDGDDE